jgi:hypothetical protein
VTGSLKFLFVHVYVSWLIIKTQVLFGFCDTRTKQEEIDLASIFW